MDIPIIYEDNHLLIVEKPINIPVQQDRSRDPDLLTLLKADLKIRYNKPGNVFLSLVHRLDRPVGGAIIFAKTSKAASRMANLLRKREIRRRYIAVTRGIVRNDYETLNHFLEKDRRKNQVYVVQSKTKRAQKAILHYRVLERRNKLTLLEVTLETGRSHQIRVQLQAIGHPLYGDQKYGAEMNEVGQQIALWSYELSFIHPVKQLEVVVRSTPPEVYPWDIWQDKIKK